MIDGHAHAEVGGPLRANGEALGQTSAGNSQDVGAGRLAPTKAEKLGPARAPGLAHANAGKLERLLRPNPFSGDLGEMSADMAEALAAPDPGSSIKGIVAALTDGRVLVPALPHEHPGRTEDGGIAEHVSEPDPTAGGSDSFGAYSGRTFRHAGFLLCRKACGMLPRCAAHSRAWA